MSSRIATVSLQTNYAKPHRTFAVKLLLLTDSKYLMRYILFGRWKKDI